MSSACIVSLRTADGEGVVREGIGGVFRGSMAGDLGGEGDCSSASKIALLELFSGIAMALKSELEDFLCDSSFAGVAVAPCWAGAGEYELSSGLLSPAEAGA